MTVSSEMTDKGVYHLWIEFGRPVTLPYFEKIITSQKAIWEREADRKARIDELKGLTLVSPEKLFTIRGCAPGRCTTVDDRISKLSTEDVKES